MNDLSETSFNSLTYLAVWEFPKPVRDTCKDVDTPFLRYGIETVLILVNVNLNLSSCGIIPPNFFDEQLLEIECLEAGNHTFSINWHVLVFHQPHGTDDLWFTPNIIFVDITKHIRLIQGQNQF